MAIPEPKGLSLCLSEPGARVAQLLVKMKDVVGAAADVNRILVRSKVDLRRGTIYPSTAGNYGIYNAFVVLKDRGLSLATLVDRIRRSPFVQDVQGFEGREGRITDTLSFPIDCWGSRVVVMSQAALVKMMGAIRSTFGSGGDVVLYEEGASYGKELAGLLSGIFGEDYLRRNFDYALNFLASTGWGIAEVRSSLGEFPSITIRVSSCSECEGRSSGQASCPFTRGFLTGMAAAVSGSSVSCEERSCRATGGHYCEFEVRTGRNSSIRGSDNHSRLEAQRGSP